MAGWSVKLCCLVLLFGVALSSPAFFTSMQDNNQGSQYKDQGKPPYENKGNDRSRPGNGMHKIHRMPPPMTPRGRPEVAKQGMNNGMEGFMKNMMGNTNIGDTMKGATGSKGMAEFMKRAMKTKGMAEMMKGIMSGKTPDSESIMKIATEMMEGDKDGAIMDMIKANMNRMSRGLKDVNHTEFMEHMKNESGEHWEKTKTDWEKPIYNMMGKYKSKASEMLANISGVAKKYMKNMARNGYEGFRKLEMHERHAHEIIYHMLKALVCKVDEMAARMMAMQAQQEYMYQRMKDMADGKPMRRHDRDWIKKRMMTMNEEEIKNLKKEIEFLEDLRKLKKQPGDTWDESKENKRYYTGEKDDDSYEDDKDDSMTEEPTDRKVIDSDEYVPDNSEMPMDGKPPYYRGRGSSTEDEYQGPPFKDPKEGMDPPPENNHGATFDKPKEAGQEEPDNNHVKDERPPWLRAMSNRG